VHLTWRSVSAPTSAPVEARGLEKRYDHVVAVDRVNLTVEPGDVYGFLGPNGAGKTTTLRMLLGLIRPDAGQVRLFGRDPQHELPEALDGVAGFVETPRFYPYLSGRKNLELLAAFDGDDAASRIDEALGVVELSARAGDRVGGYSQGMRQRLGIASALIRAPRLLLLDEPTANLDLHHQVAMLELVRGLSREHGLAVIAAVHDLQLAALYCDRVALLNQGQVVSQGSPEAVLTAPLLLETFGQQVVLSPHPTHGVPLVALVPNGNARRLTPGAASRLVPLETPPS
jgi:ABC-2 type transport system ATP-binding protein